LGESLSKTRYKRLTKPKWR